MNPEQLKEYKREKSRQFNANLKALRLKEKAKNQTDTIDQQDNTIDKQDDNQTDTIDKQDENQDDKLSLEDLLVKMEEYHSSKIDELLNNVDELLDTKLDELFNRLDIIETIIETKLETKLKNKMQTKLETNTLLPQFKPILFAWTEKTPPFQTRRAGA